MADNGTLEEIWNEAGLKGFINFTRTNFFRSSYEEAGEMFIPQPSGIVLDGGCGGGGLFQKILEKIKPSKIVAVDFSESLLEEAKKTAQKLVNDGELFEFPDKIDLTKTFPWLDNTFDTEIFNIVIEHFPPRKWKKTIKEALRTLKPGGYIYINTHLKGWEKEGISLITVLRFLEELIRSPVNALKALGFHLRIFLPRIRGLARKGVTSAPERGEVLRFLQQIGFTDCYITSGRHEYEVERLRAKKPSL